MSFSDPLVVYLDGVAQTSSQSLNRVDGPTGLRSRYYKDGSTTDRFITISHKEFRDSQGLVNKRRHTIEATTAISDGGHADFGAEYKAYVVIEHNPQFSDTLADELCLVLSEMLNDSAVRDKLHNLET